MGIAMQESSQIKFLYILAMLQVIIIAIFFLLARYDEGASPLHAHTPKGQKMLKRALEAYPLGVDIMMMLFGGFGYLMTFLKRYGLGAVGLTMIISAIITEFSLVVIGLTRMSEFVIHIGFIEIIEASVTSASVLIAFGAVIGKINPLQMLIMGILGSIGIVLNFYLGYTIMGTNDVGGSIYLHVFGAYYGLAVSFMMRKKKVDLSSEREGARYTSDILSLLGTVFLWVFWPSFNGALAVGDARERCYLNTYISLMASTITTFFCSGILGNKKFSLADIQNATLAGGVAVGATADMVLQPYGAIVAGSLAGIISTMGYNFLQKFLYEKLSLHDTCGVHNLHGMPGLLAGFSSVLVVMLAGESNYGYALYKVFPLCAPVADSSELLRIQEQFPEIGAGLGRTIGFQALMQLIGVSSTFLIAIIYGSFVGLFLSWSRIFDPLGDHELFDDEHFWNMPDHDDVGFLIAEAGSRRKSRSRSIFKQDLGGSMQRPALDGHHNSAFHSLH